MSKKVDPNKEVKIEEVEVLENPDFQEVEEQLEDMTIAKLRQFASLQRVAFNKDSTKQEIIDAIKYRGRGQTLAKIAKDGSPPPGFCKIRLMKDGGPKSRNLPVYVHINGRTATIPRGVPCLVPYKVVELLRNSTHPQLIEDASLAFNDPKRITIEDSPSYPVELRDATPGPDPWPGNEVGKAASYGPRLKVWKLFGRWPKRGEVHDAIKQGFIKMEIGENVSLSEIEAEKRPNQR